MKNIKALFAASLFATAASANAGILVANDSFSITSKSVTNASSVKNDAGGEGWAGGWQTKMTAATAPQLVAVRGMEGTALQFKTNADQAAYRVLEDSVDGDILVDFLIQYSGAPAVNTFLGFWFGSPTGPSIGLKTDCGTGGKCTDDFFARTNGVAGPFIPNSNTSAGTTYHLFGHLYKSKPGASYDTFDAWLNPTAEEMLHLTGWDLRATGASGLYDFDTVGFRSYGIATGVSVSVDALNLNAVPEPGSLALIGLAAAGLGFVRRRTA